jgi:hypothetical protein
MIEAGMVNRAKLDFLQGLHQPNDEYYIALYTDRADLSLNTQKYTIAEEVRASGYDAGGKKLMGYKSGLIDDMAYITFNAIDWQNSSISAKGAMIYNASKGDVALVVLNFEEVKKSSVGLFRIEFPVPSEDGAVIWIA